MRVVVADQPVGRVEDRRVGPVVPAQDDGPGAEVAVLEVEDVVDRRAAERVDRLVVVADDRHVPMAVGQRRDELRLGTIGVLELVDEDVAIPAGDRRARRRRGADKTEGQRDLVAEVDAAVGRQEILIGRVGAGELGLATALLGRGSGGVGRQRIVRLAGGHLGQECRLGGHAVGMDEVVGRRDVLVLAATEQGRQRREEPRRIAEWPVGVQVEFEEVLAQEDDDLRARQDAQIGRQAELERMVADEPVTEGVEGRDRRIRVAVRHELVDPDRHLVGGLVGEGQGEDLRRLRPVGGDQPRDPARDHLGLAGPRASDDQQRSAAVGHGATLLRVETPKERVKPGIVRPPGDRRVHDRDEVAPGRQLVER